MVDCARMGISRRNMIVFHTLWLIGPEWEYSRRRFGSLCQNSNYTPTVKRWFSALIDDAVQRRSMNGCWQTAARA